MANLQVALEAVQQENATLRNRLEHIPMNPVINQPHAAALEPKVATYNTPDEINLEIFKSLSTFDGTKSNYRLWREDATRLMNSISGHSNSNRYVEALTIVKSKIVGPAANILLNHNTIFNFEAILNRLDYTYCDQRPLYVLKDELTKLTQGKSSLSEFHDEVSKALTVVTSKIAMSGDPPESIQCMTAHAMEDAVRTFKNGINDNFIRSTLYGNPIKDLEHAYAISQTIEHDNNHRSNQHNFHHGNNRSHQRQREQPHQRLEGNQHFRRPSYHLSNQQNQQQHQLHQNYPKPEPMDISSGNTRQIQHNPQGFHSQPWKRMRDQSGNFNNKNKFQRNNRIETTKNTDDNSSTTTEKSSKSRYNNNSINKSLN